MVAATLRNMPGALERGRSQLVAAGDVFHRALDRRQILLGARSAGASVHRAGAGRFCVDRHSCHDRSWITSFALVDAVEGQQRGRFIHTIGAAPWCQLRRVVSRNCMARIICLALSGVGMRRSLIDLHRIVRSRVVRRASALRPPLADSIVKGAAQSFRLPLPTARFSATCSR